jgi:LemA protein
MSAAPSRVRANPRWLVPVAIVVGVLLLLVLPAVTTYNSLVNKEEAVDESFANLDASLQRRYDLIPNLVNAVRGILRQEQEVFGELARARAAYAGATTPEDKAQASGQIETGLGRLLAIVENFPQLRSSENVRDLQVALEGTENRINQARRDYNGTVRDYNSSSRRFPRSLFAGMFGFDRKPPFEAAPASRDAPTVDLETETTPTSLR